jgi:hypothetical protein
MAQAIAPQYRECESLSSNPSTAPKIEVLKKITQNEPESLFLFTR